MRALFSRVKPGQRAVRMVSAVVVTLAFSILLERNSGPGDLAFSLQALLSSRDVPTTVKVVRIDDGDYLRLFGGTSPLNHDTVARIIAVIAAARPRVIGVDLDSADPWFATLPDSINGIPLVWSRTFGCRDHESPAADCPAGQRLPRPAAGRREPGRERAGIIMLPQEADGSLLHYSRAWKAQADIHPAFSTLVLQRAGHPVASEVPEVTRFIRYRRSTWADSTYTARWVIDSLGHHPPANNVFRDKIVLLGGTFWYGRDHYTTPVGTLSGVEIVAQVIETELEGGGPRTPPAWRFFLVQCLAGFGIVAVYRRRALKAAFWTSLALAAVAAPAISLLVFGTWRLWFYFLPVLSIWLIQQLYEEAKSYRDRLLLSEGPAPYHTSSKPTPASDIGAPESGKGVAPP